jgi:hypothetical protein
MPLRVKTVFHLAEETVELPDDATVLTVKEWASNFYGLRVEEIRVATAIGVSRIPKDEELLSSNPKLLQLKIAERPLGG